MVLNRLGVIGAGMMGSEIALVFAMAGKDVRLIDRDPALVDKAMGALNVTLDKGVKRGFWDDGAAERARAHLKPAASLADYADRDMVIEAVFEQEDIKAAVFRELDGILKPEAVIASNTSSISITGLASHVKPERRSRFLGTHFFSPVSRMKLVEVIPALDTDPAVFDQVMELCRGAGKTPIKVKDVTGFAVNRLLHAFLIEAAKLIEEEVASPADIDTACKLGLGHPMGPFELMDVVTNRLTLQVQEVLHDSYGARFMPSPALRQMVRAGYDGRKTGRGWFRYPDKTK